MLLVLAMTLLVGLGGGLRSGGGRCGGFVLRFGLASAFTAGLASALVSILEAAGLAASAAAAGLASLVVAAGAAVWAWAMAPAANRLNVREAMMDLVFMMVPFSVINLAILPTPFGRAVSLGSVARSLLIQRRRASGG